MLSLYIWILHSSGLQMQGHVHQNFIIVCLMKHESGSTVRLARERHVGWERQSQTIRGHCLHPSMHVLSPLPLSHSGLNFNLGGNEPNVDWLYAGWIGERLSCIYLVPSCDSSLSHFKANPIWLCGQRKVKQRCTIKNASRKS